MRGNQRISLILPCLNEAEGLKRLLPEIPSWVDEIVVVDNNSTDASATIAHAAGARVVQEARPGYGHAHQAGLRAATGTILAAMDGDGQYPPAALADLIDPLLERRADFVSGCRVPFPRGSVPAYRRAGNALLNFVGALLFGVRVQDNQSGMWAMRREVPERLRLTRGDMAFSEEIKYKAIRAGFRFCETYVGYRPRYGPSKLLPLSAGLKNLSYLFRLWWQSVPRHEDAHSVFYRPLEIARNRIQKLWHVADVVAPWIVIGVFSVGYVRLAWYNYLQFDTGLDLGIYNQALYHLSHLRLPFSTFKNEVLWGDHAHFFLVLLAPLYRVFPDPRTLTIIQALAITTAGWPIYQIALKTLKSRPVALSLLFAMLSFVGIQYALDFDFHVTVFTGAALAWMLYAFHTRRPLVYWLTLALALLTKEDAAPIVLMIGVYVLFLKRWRLALATMASAAAYFVLSAYVLMPVWSPSHQAVIHFDVETYGRGALRNTIGTLFHPTATAKAMTDVPTKRHTIRILFEAFGYLPLATPFTYLASVPIFLSRFLSREEYRWGLDYHYNANILPVLAYGTILGARNVLAALARAPWGSQRYVRRTLLAAVAAVLLVSTYRTSWIHSDIPLRRLTLEEFVGRDFVPRYGIATFNLVKEMIPEEKSVSASSGFVAALSSRPYIFNFPEPKNKNVKWIVVSPEFNTWPLRKGEMEESIAALEKNPVYETVWSDYGIWAFRKR